MREWAKETERLHNLKSIAYEKSIFLSDAVGKGDIDAAKKHLDDGGDVNLGNPLNVAIESRNNRRKKMVKLLLALGFLCVAECFSEHPSHHRDKRIPLPESFA